MTRTEYPPLLECCRGMWNHKKDCPQMTQRNAAAERLWDVLDQQPNSGEARRWLDEALAAERRATVERIRTRFENGALDWRKVLDEEAAR